MGIFFKGMKFRSGYYIFVVEDEGCLVNGDKNAFWEIKYGIFRLKVKVWFLLKNWEKVYYIVEFVFLIIEG